VALLGGGARNFVLGKKVMDNSNYDKPVCLECGDKIKGRSDKKFCNDACRSAHHNKKNKVVSNPQKTINNLLSKNRRILKDCFEQDIVMILDTLQVLMARFTLPNTQERICKQVHPPILHYLCTLI